MAIYVVVGPMGSGKTTLVTAMGVTSYLLDGTNIFSNYRLANIPYTYFHPSEFVDLMESEELKHATVLLDEAYLLMDSRASGAKINRLFAAFAYQARKRDVDLFIATHHTGHVDLRIRRAMTYRWRPRFNPATNVITVYSKNIEISYVRRFQVQADRFWKYFDTNEVLELPKTLKRIEF